MSEIEKMYENAGILPRRKCEFYENCPIGFGHSCNDCDVEFTEFNSSYPPFTAEKQIELIKWLKNNRDFHTCGSWCTALDSTGETIEYSDSEFKEALAGLINQLFMAQDLTEKEKQQVKGILE